MKRILVINQYNSDNIGDNLLNEMLCLNLKRMGYNTDNVGYAQQHKQVVEYKIDDSKVNFVKLFLKRIISPWLKYQLIYKLKLNTSQKNLKKQKWDAVIIGGGQLLKHNSVFMYCFRHWINWAKKNDIPIILHGIGVDSELSKYEIKVYKKYLRYVQVVNCRDIETKEIMKQKFDVKAYISPDIAFTYSNEKVGKDNKNAILVMPYSYLTARRSFKFNISKSQYFKTIEHKIKNIKEKEPDLKVVLAATTSDDASECYRFAEWYANSGEKCIVRKIQDSDTLFQEACKSKYMITGRMHAMIVGLIAGAKIEPILVSNKIKFFEINYLKQEIDLREISRQAFEGLEKSVKKVLF